MLYVAGRVRVVRALYKYTAQYVSTVTLSEHVQTASLHLYLLIHSRILLF